jgi:hypothetical protein
MTKEKDPNENVLNPRLLVFPQDSTGYLYKMKNEVLKAIERQNGNPDKHDALMGTLQVLARFARRRMAMQAETRAAAMASVSEAVEVPEEPEQPAGDAPVPQEGQSEPTKTEGAADGTN